MAKIGKLTGYHVVYTPGRTKNGIKIGKISEKYDILTVEEKRIDLIRNNTRRSLLNGSKANRVRVEKVEGVKDTDSEKKMKKEKHCQILVEKYVECSYSRSMKML